jgi:ferritin-like metal-binding protein YciE
MFEKVEIHDPHELMTHKLGAALTMESTVLEMLEKLQEKAHGAGLRQLLRHHAEETQGQIHNLEQAFMALGEEPKQKPCPAIQGLENEGEANLKITADALVDAVILAGCAETEHHEIAVYDGLITHAGAMDAQDIVALLTENLEQEQHTLREVERATEQEARAQAVASS